MMQDEIKKIFPQKIAEAVTAATPTDILVSSIGTTVKDLAGAKAALATKGISSADRALILKEYPKLSQSRFLGGEGIVGPIIAIVAWSALAFTMGKYVFGPLFGLTPQQSNTLGYALAAGTATGLIVHSPTLFPGFVLSGWASFGLGTLAAFVIFAFFAKKSSAETIQYNCYQWDAQSGKELSASQKTDRCDMCNKQGNLVCTEYQCRSLGQGCVLINEENSGRQLCIWNNTKDINPPIIKPWEDALLDNFAYTPVNTISPPDKGVNIKYIGNERVTSDGNIKCAPAYTPISFGVQLDEPSKCKISPVKLLNYAEMADIYMGRGIRDYNQSFALSLPSQEALEAENITVDNGGKYELFVRCEDANGNSNIGNFVFKFCVSEGPDTTPPLIAGTSIYNNQPIAHGQKSIDIELYVNEPSECRWSRLDKSYEAMEEEMTCATSVTEMNSQMLYTCRDSLTGLKDDPNNRFYFRCKDQPSLKGTEKEGDRNVNSQSYPLTLIGTQPLVIEKVGPSGIIEDSTEVIKVNLTVETTSGYDEGKAVCAFSETGNSGSYIDFFYGYDIEIFSQYKHSQELWLAEGDYNYFIRCRDMGGNIDDAEINFKVETDTSSPMVVRVFKEDDYLKVITDEPGECVYSNFGCTYLFEDGTEMISLEDKEYYAEWNINQDFYVKCKDNYGNMPVSNACSIIVRPFEIFEPKPQ